MTFAEQQTVSRFEVVATLIPNIASRLKNLSQRDGILGRDVHLRSNRATQSRHPDRPLRFVLA